MRLQSAIIFLIEEQRRMEIQNAKRAWEAAYLEAKQRADAQQSFENATRRFETAQILDLRLRGACNARGMMESIQDMLLLNEVISKDLQPRDVWARLFQKNKDLLDAARTVGLRAGKNVISSAKDAGQAMTAIFKQLSDKIHDRRTAKEYESDGDYVIIPMTVLNEEQAKILHKIAKVYNYPVRIQTPDGRIADAV